MPPTTKCSSLRCIRSTVSAIGGMDDRSVSYPLGTVTPCPVHDPTVRQRRRPIGVSTGADTGQPRSASALARRCAIIARRASGLSARTTSRSVALAIAAPTSACVTMPLASSRPTTAR